jgi:branched-chain amino acid transport system substrate-binding protein
MKKTILFFILIILCIFIYFNYNKKYDNITIGFVGALTGKYSVLGNAIMNGVQLAFEEIDYKIADKKIQILFKDDKQNKQLDKDIVNSFITNDIKIIIGNLTSTMSKVTMSIVNKHKDMFMISAASASNEFSRKDDQFFRIHIADNIQRFDSYSKFILKNGYKTIYAIYDPKNKIYSFDYLIYFEKNFIKNGGERFLKYARTDENLDLLVEDIKRANPDVILICANSVDTARILQYIRLKKIETQIALSAWSMTPYFIENAGKASEGVLFNVDYDMDSKNPNYLKFVKNYKKKYNSFPSIYAAKGYELSKILIEALTHVDETKIKEYILKKKVFDGLQDEIIFDEYGDVVRKLYNIKVKNGKYVRVK